MSRSVSRRGLLAAALGALTGASTTGLAGCAPATPTQAPTAGGQLDEQLAKQAAKAAVELQSDYRGVIQRHPSLRRQLAPLAAHHAEHAATFSIGAPPRARPGRTPVGRARAVRRLRDAELAVRAERVRAANRAESGDLARVLASAAACQSQHLVLLGRIRL